MFIDINSIVINNISIGRYITQAQYGYNKLWGSDSGRNLAGTQSGTLLGIFPKIILQFRALNKSELETIIPILDSANQSVSYYDPNKRATVTMTTYTGDYEIINKNIIEDTDIGAKNEPFSCSFISVDRRM